MSAKGKWDRRSWHRKAGRPVSLWLGAIVVAGLVHQFLPNSRWVLIHLFTLGAVTNSIVVWSQHFTEKFLHAPAPDEARPWQLRRIYALNLGIVVTVVGQLTTFWQVTTVGAAIVGLILAWHAIALARQYRQHNEQQRYAPVVLAYVASACCMPFGATAGALLAAGVGTPWYDRLKLAHLAINILGFLGFAAVGSLAILFPTIWRTRAGTDRMGQVLSLTMVGLLTIVIGSLLGLGQIAGAGLLIYCGGWIIAAFPWANNVRTVLQEPRDRVTFASVSVAAAPLWLIGSLLYLAVQAIEADTHVAHVNLPTLSLLVGFAAQLLIGVMSFLLPSTIGGGPGASRAGLQTLDRAGLFRSTLLNVGLALWLLSPSERVTSVVSVLALASLAAFIPLVAMSVRAQRAVLMKRVDAPKARSAPAYSQVTAALAVLALVAGTLGGGFGSGDGGNSGGSSNTVAATGETTRVTVSAKGMSFEPNVIRVPTGNRLEITLVNNDNQIHDLKVASGAETGRLGSGEQATIDAGVIGKEMEGWCTIAGHRQQGMTLTIVPDQAGSGGHSGSGNHNGHGGHGGQHQQHSGQNSQNAAPLEQANWRNPELAPREDTDIHRVTLDVQEISGPVRGVERGWWTFNGRPMGPTLRGKVGDVFEVTLKNSGTISHSLDFHAGMVSPDEPMRSIAPGEELVYRFTAEHAGIWLYHCGTAPVSMHIASGMFGAVVIDPPDLAPVDHEYLLVQSEVYGLEGTSDTPVDSEKLAAGVPDAVVFNGIENQYVDNPIQVKAGESTRFWLLNAGPNLSEAFHIVGTQFHTSYKEGAYLLRDSENQGGSQALDLLAAQGGFVEARFPEAGIYTMVNHQFIDAERGAMGKVKVE